MADCTHPLSALHGDVVNDVDCILICDLCGMTWPESEFNDLLYARGAFDGTLYGFSRHLEEVFYQVAELISASVFRLLTRNRR